MALPVRSAVIERSPIAIVPPTSIDGSDRDLSCEVVKLAQTAEQTAHDLRASGQRATAASMVCRPAARFFRDYVMRGGWRHGVGGFVLATMAAFAVFVECAALLLSE